MRSPKDASWAGAQPDDDWSKRPDSSLLAWRGHSITCDTAVDASIDLGRSPIRFLLIARMLWDKGVGEYVEAARLLKRSGLNAEVCLLGFLDVQNPAAISKSQMDEWVAEGVVRYLGVSDNVREEIA
jgi:hypothetical protein